MVGGTRRGRCIGIVGGLGPGATVHYHEELLRRLQEAGADPDIVIVHADVGRVLDLIGRGELDALAGYLSGFLGRLADAGAELAVVPAVAPHVVAGRLADLSPLPLVDLVEATRGGLLARGLRRLALFGTRFAVESDLFGKLSEFEVIRATDAEIDAVHEAYLALVRAGGGSDPIANALRRIATRLIADEGVEAIVLAGTELSLLVREGRVGYPVVDCASLQINDAVRRAADLPPLGENLPVRPE